MGLIPVSRRAGEGSLAGGSAAEGDRPASACPLLAGRRVACRSQAIPIDERSTLPVKYPVHRIRPLGDATTRYRWEAFWAYKKSEPLSLASQPSECHSLVLTVAASHAKFLNTVIASHFSASDAEA